MIEKNIVRYSLDIPEDLLNKIRMLSVQRKIAKHEKRSQKDVFIELLEIGLLHNGYEL